MLYSGEPSFSPVSAQWGVRFIEESPLSPQSFLQFELCKRGGVEWAEIWDDSQLSLPGVVPFIEGSCFALKALLDNIKAGRQTYVEANLAGGALHAKKCCRLTKSTFFKEPGPGWRIVPWGGYRAAPKSFHSLATGYWSRVMLLEMYLVNVELDRWIVCGYSSHILGIKPGQCTSVSICKTEP